MLDEIQEFKQYTFVPVDKLSEKDCRLKYSNLIKSHFSGLNRALTIIARQYIFGDSDYVQNFDEVYIREQLKKWCNDWLERYIRYVFLSRFVRDFKDWLVNNTVDDRDNVIIDILDSIVLDDELKVLLDKCDELMKWRAGIDNEHKVAKEKVDRIIAVLKALHELKLKRSEFSKSVFQTGSKLVDNQGASNKKNDINKITYDRIIANALELGRLHRYYLVCKNEVVPYNSVRKYTCKNSNGKKLLDTDKDLILKMTAAYLLQKNNCEEGYISEFFLITLVDISNWMIKKDKPSNFEFDKYRLTETGENLFIMKSLGGDNAENSKRGKRSKICLNPKWVDNFYLIEEKELEMVEKQGRIFFSDVAGSMLCERAKKRYGS